MCILLHYYLQVEIQVKVTFLRIIDVLTVDQSYKADIFLQAKWFDPKLEEVKEKVYRHPHILIFS